MADAARDESPPAEGVAAPPGFAGRFAPPYYAVIFTSRVTADIAGYPQTAQRMFELAAAQPGYLGVESTHGRDGLGITVSYWESLQAIAGWRAEMEHSAARERGRGQWYSHYELRIARVERAYGWHAPEAAAAVA